ncbi:hypothetical protein DLM45_03555 [Hyphomicrobium methylovorum]|uniref:hypothetical protein n=1 Tax=Hyphomicrobium methylovorum TaxID=84 RepID=UPI0015E6DEA9|nr:hypothetical protein [Hyphomicrobium methylovorum]MBA2125299.1 hypothetical protein [Hyphomicrobium methylovorum]
MSFPIFRIVIFLSALVLAGCGDEQPRERAAEHHSGIKKSGVETSWLGARDEIEPVDWLVARQKQVGRPIKEGDEADLEKALARASALFRGEPRMIANRAVQLEEMLSTEGEHESAVWLITALTGVVSEPSRVESFGAVGQQYYNMRKAGFTGKKALEELSKRYGASG